MQILNAFIPIWEEIRAGVEAAIPLLMKAALVYLGIRFALVVSSVIIRLAQFNAPPPDPQEIIDPENAMDTELTDADPGGNAPPGDPAALPESTSETR